MTGLTLPARVTLRPCCQAAKCWSQVAPATCRLTGLDTLGARNCMILPPGLGPPQVRW
jgi:hypothetical protein